MPLDEPGQPANDRPAMPAPVIGDVRVLGESGYPGRGPGGVLEKTTRRKSAFVIMPASWASAATQDDVRANTATRRSEGRARPGHGDGGPTLGAGLTGGRVLIDDHHRAEYLASGGA
jgi:hypothetical protein